MAFDANVGLTGDCGKAICGRSSTASIRLFCREKVGSAVATGVRRSLSSANKNYTLRGTLGWCKNAAMASATAPMKQHPTIEKITPEMAERLLAANRRNRNLRKAWVEKLADMMSNREWAFTGETIKLTEDGTLLDGQHRLAAVVASGVAIQAVVVRGLPIEAQDTVDVGRGRRLADVLAIEGYTDANALAATINFYHRYRTREREPNPPPRLDNWRGSAPTPQQALALIDEVPQLRESVRRARRLTKEIGGPLGVFAALHSVFQEIDPSATARFFDELEIGAELQRGDPVLHLRNQIMRPRRDRHYAHTPYYAAAITIKAFNYRRADKKIDLLSFRANERFPMAVHGRGQAGAR